MRRAMSASVGLVLLVVGLTGCADRMSTAPVASAQQECERTGGTWRSGSCERASGGGY